SESDNPEKNQSKTIIMNFSRIKTEQEKKRLLIHFYIRGIPAFLTPNFSNLQKEFKVKKYKMRTRFALLLYGLNVTITSPPDLEICMSQLLPNFVFNIDRDHFFAHFYTSRLYGKQLNYTRMIKNTLHTEGNVNVNFLKCQQKFKKQNFQLLKHLLKRFKTHKNRIMEGEKDFTRLDYSIIKKFENMIIHLKEMDAFECSRVNLKIGIVKIIEFETAFIEDRQTFQTFQGMSNEVRYLKLVFDTMCDSFNNILVSAKRCLDFI
ncbi:hypothetical protein CDIK_3957, partial [Cucumispora dikerogammari]